ncbi:MAG TPA: zf-HC2 domain-containing protein, partial [Pyrinomonadaceae bacterium]|nr:zf-HC2 domain-containing protein [Pyrinomonadaceae bacterium]
MFSKHIDKKLSAYCHGELAPEESREIAEHLIACHECRSQFEEIKLGVKFAEHLPQVSAPDSLWADLQTRIAAESNSSTRERPPFTLKLWQPRFAAAFAALLLVVGLGAFWLYTRESRPSWEVAAIDGAPRIGSSRLDDKGRLAVGQWLETDGASRARIEVSSIGQVEVAPNTRIRLMETKPTEHRLELQRGKMSAMIWAPPRLFFVNTP